MEKKETLLGETESQRQAMAFGQTKHDNHNPDP